MLIMGARHDQGSNPHSHNCESSTLPLSYPDIPRSVWLVCYRAAEKKCPYQWVEFSGHCYQFVTEHWRNYFAASQECEKLGAHLVYLDTDDEITWVKGYRLHNDIG